MADTVQVWHSISVLNLNDLFKTKRPDRSNNIKAARIPIVTLGENKIQVCNGGYTAGTGAQCEWEISKTSCRLLACYVGGTNYTGSATTIYVR